MGATALDALARTAADSGSANFEQVLAKFLPEGLAAEGSGWQQRKSAQTRIGILDAAIECLASHGYARTTTQLIAETAGISRGAMLHHYPTKGALIEAIISYCVYRRMQRLAEGVRRLPELQRIQEFAGLEVLWETFLSPEHRAFLELNIASRTDAEVRESFTPQAQKLNRLWREEGIRVFPEWAGSPERLSRASDLVEAVLEGMAFSQDIWNSPERIARLRGFLKELVGRIYSGEIDPAPKV